MVGSLLDVIDRLGKGAVDCTALGDSRLLVTDRGEKGMCEPQTGIVELDHALTHSRLEGFLDGSLVAICGRDQLDRRPGQSGTEHEDVERLGRQPSETAAEELVQARRDGQRQAGLRPRARANQLTAELERKERVAFRDLLHPSKLGPGQLQPKPVPE
jgi:hypothetical protein